MGSASVVVVGSVNLDGILRLPSIPRRGESRLASRVFVGAGGKGANQAAQAARLGVTARLVGRVGADGASSILLQALEDAGVGTDALERGGDSGLGVVFTDPRGGNWIGVAPRANASLAVADVERHAALI